ncbi:MAG: OmpA family protein [Methylococcales bacterium]|nr:OmpA family protein [Methylococcales bacterium]
MSSSFLPKHHASLSIEDISEQSNRSEHNWLLTYLDVFVLIIMLVITLMALSDFETNHQSKEQKIITEKKSNHHIESTNTPSKMRTTLQTQIENNSFIDKTKNHQGKKIISNRQSNKNKLQEQLTKAIKELGLHSAVDMKVTLGYAQLEIQDKILFKSSEANLLGDGQILLKKLAPLLAQSLGLIFIEGHTDNRPIKTKRFPSNWELGATRATNVLHYLATQDIDSSRLRAISSAATKPISDNVTSEGREKNRRVSIMIQVADKIN